ncbi:MAG: alpha/beta fold hydrolase [Sphingobacteriaceae bacterium]|nr:alpha/beta fold hydrolase [Cytophagaceae bacterium]
MPETPLTIPALDGFPLAARLLTPEGAPKAVVQVNGGTAIRKEFYGSFARFLVEHGYAVCIWDFRGTGESAPASLRGFQARCLDWGTLDMPAVLDFLSERFPALPLLFMGHSAGGQQVGFMPNYQKVRGMVCFATSSGYWGFMPPGYRFRTVHFYFHLLVPVMTALRGYAATGWTGAIDDLPAGVARDWRDWCSRPDYFFDEKFFGKTVPRGHFDALSFPIKVYWATDDPISNARAVPAFWQHVHSKKYLEIEALRPAEHGLKSIGHFGFFRKMARETLWRKALEDLEEMRLGEGNDDNDSPP